MSGLLASAFCREQYKRRQFEIPNLSYSSEFLETDIIRFQISRVLLQLGYSKKTKRSSTKKYVSWIWPFTWLPLRSWRIIWERMSRDRGNFKHKELWKISLMGLRCLTYVSSLTETSLCVSLNKATFIHTHSNSYLSSNTLHCIKRDQRLKV